MNTHQDRNSEEVPADIETSSASYASRFQGPAGAWMLQVQERAVLNHLTAERITSILEVGGGHGHLTTPLLKAGFQVTVQGSSESCQRGIAELLHSNRCRFVLGSFLQLPFADRSFDAVVCVRLIMHSEVWTRIIAELCRVARNTVVVDYPLASPLADRLWGAKKKLKINTRPWRSFRHEEIAGAFVQQGFIDTGRRGQFFFPMVLHRTLQQRWFSAALEGTAGLLRLHQHWGSPVLARFGRSAT